MGKEQFGATGRRKTSVARAVLMPGEGKFTVNGRDITDYLKRDTLVQHAQHPLVATDMQSSINVNCTAKGGGLSGQAGAMRLAVSRALALMNPDLRQQLRECGFLTRDPRKVERKKYGQPKARKRYQYSKR
ncbi:MAG: 30S ribosomal protein S9 [Candidatus Zixiibacteriota bacterium]